MGSFELPRLAELDEDAIARFREQGFLIVERVLDVDRTAALHDRFRKLFAGQFDTAVYPDEWHWRERMSLPDVTRHMGRCLESRSHGRAPRLVQGCGLRGGTPGWLVGHAVRSGHNLVENAQDKADRVSPGHLLTDFLDPPAMVTCWVTLDDTYPDVGTLEYAAGSHLCPLTPIPEEFQGQKDYRGHMRAAARAAGVDVPEPAIMSCPLHRDLHAVRRGAIA